MDGIWFRRGKNDDYYLYFFVVLGSTLDDEEEMSLWITGQWLR
jgi:hypothetical protein